MKYLLAGCLLCVSLLPAPAFANSFTATEGFWRVSTVSGLIAYNLSGPGFSVSGEDTGVIQGTGPLTTSSVFFHESRLAQEVSLTVHGQTFEQGGVDLRVTAPLALPASYPPGTEVTVQGLAILDGTLLTFAAGDEGTTIHTLTGSGLASASFFGFDFPPNRFAFIDMRVDFGPSLTAVPEPGTWLLLGSGFIGLAVGRRKLRG